MKLTVLPIFMSFAVPTGIEPVWFGITFLLSDSQASTPCRPRDQILDDSAFSDHGKLSSLHLLIQVQNTRGPYGSRTRTTHRDRVAL